MDALKLPKRSVPSMWFQCLLGRIQACQVDLLHWFKQGAGVTSAKPIMRMARHHLIQVAFGYPFSPMSDRAEKLHGDLDLFPEKFHQISFLLW